MRHCCLSRRYGGRHQMTIHERFLDDSVDYGFHPILNAVYQLIRVLETIKQTEAHLPPPRIKIL